MHRCFSRGLRGIARTIPAWRLAFAKESEVAQRTNQCRGTQFANGGMVFPSPHEIHVDESFLSQLGFTHGASMIHFRNIYWDNGPISPTHKTATEGRLNHPHPSHALQEEGRFPHTTREAVADLDLGPIGHSGLNDV